MKILIASTPAPGHLNPLPTGVNALPLSGFCFATFNMGSKRRHP